MKAWIGKSLFIIGIGHSLIGFIVFRNTIALIINENLVNTISLNGNSSKEAAFWFLVTGFALMIIGGLVNLIENKNIGMPAFLLWCLIFVTAIGIFMMPVSGFWLLLVPILGLLLRRMSEFKEMNYKEKIKKLVDTQNSLLEEAHQSLLKEIKNEDADEGSFGPNGPAMHADFIAFQLIIDSQYELAARMYRLLANETVKWREKNGKPRHAGRFLANLGTASLLQGDLDQAYIELWNAAKEDEITYGTSPDKSFAMTEMFRNNIAKPALEFAENQTKAINRDVTYDQLNEFYQFLGSSRYVFVASLRMAETHQDIDDSEIGFSHQQKLNALRLLGVLIEIEIRKICRPISKISIHKMLENYNNQSNIPWFQDFDNRRQGVGATINSTRHIDDQLNDALATPTNDDNERFWVSLLVGYIVRNYSAHEMDITTNFLNDKFLIVFGHMVYAMVHAKRYI